MRESHRHIGYIVVLCCPLSMQHLPRSKDQVPEEISVSDFRGPRSFYMSRGYRGWCWNVLESWPVCMWDELGRAGIWC